MRATICAGWLCFLLAGSAAAAEPFGNKVARCLAERQIAPNAPDFGKQAESCERSVAMDETRDAWQICVARAVAALDDRISPASDIAAAASDQCGEEYEAMLNATTMPPSGRQAAHAQRTETTRQMGIKLVLMQRAEANRQQQATPTKKK